MSDDTEFNEWAKNVIKGENRYCQRAVVTKVNGTCPFGHREGDTFTGSYSTDGVTWIQEDQTTVAMFSN